MLLMESQEVRQKNENTCGRVLCWELEFEHSTQHGVVLHISVKTHASAQGVAVNSCAAGDEFLILASDLQLNSPRDLSHV